MEGESSAESSSDSSSGSSNSSTSSTSSDECRPSPAKKVKKTKVKKSAPHKKLAKKAAKKGDCKSEKTILELAEQAMRIESEAVGKEMEKELIRIGKLFAKWKENDVEEENIQLFAAKVLNELKKLDILCAVDTAIFKNEIGRVRLLGMEVEPMDSQKGFNRLELKNRAESLLEKVIDTENARLDQTKEGTAWNVRSLESINPVDG